MEEPKLIRRTVEGEMGSGWPAEYECYTKESVDALVQHLRDRIAELTPPATPLAPDSVLTYEPPKLNEVVAALVAERRQYQDIKWGGPKHDDTHTLDYWCETIKAYITWAQQMARNDSPHKYRKRMIDVTALGWAALESFERIKAASTGTRGVCGRCYDQDVELFNPNCDEDPVALEGQPIGQYHCPDCGAMILAGVPHPPLCVRCLTHNHPGFDKGVA